MTSIELDSPRWAELSDAYGPASEIPALLKKLRTAEPSDADGPASGILALLKKLRTARPPKRHDSEPWFSLWSGLCHQNTVYTASYAAVPHLIEIARDAAPRARIELFALVACIELGRVRGDAAAMPPDLDAPYQEALIGASGAILALLASDTMTEVDYRTLLAASAAVHGYHALGDAMLAMDCEIECPKCGAYFAPERTV